MFAGAQIGGYRMLRQIGEGGMGEVWEAEHAMLGRRAALKILHPSYTTQKEIVGRFFNEARAATAISDPGIIQIFDFGYHTDGSAYIVMELLEGEPLDKRLKRQGALSVGDALRLCRQIAGSVGAAHARGIIHRDLKPENIVVVRDPEVTGGERAKVLDFGIAKLTKHAGDQSKTQTSAIIGTPLYMSPEQCRGAGGVDERADVYALGCLMFALVTGRPPFGAAGSGEVIIQHVTARPPRPSERSLAVPPEVDELILRCLAKKPADRFASGAALAIAIDAVISNPAVSRVAYLPPKIVPHDANTTLGASIAQSASEPPRRRTSMYVALAASSVVVGGVIAAIIAPREPAAPMTVRAEPRPPEHAALIAPPQPEVDPRPAQARADMKSLLAAFSTWAASHADAPCPTSAALGTAADPWGNAYELTCTDQPADQAIGIVSRGPDRAPATDDDLTSWTMGRDVTELARGKRWTPAAIATTKKPAAKKPPTQKPPPPQTAQPLPPPPPKPAAKPTGIVDIDGDGIPDARR